MSAVPRTGAISKRDEIVVFWIVRDSACAECGEELGKGRFLRMETERPLCLRCADLDHLVFLERGDAALTRRANRYSTLRAVVVGLAVPANATSDKVYWSKSQRSCGRNRNAYPTPRRVDWLESARLNDVRRTMPSISPRLPGGWVIYFRMPHRAAAGNRRARMPEVLGPSWQVGGREGTTSKRGRSCRSSSRQARAHAVRRTACERRGARRSSRSGSRSCGEMPRCVATW